MNPDEQAVDPASVTVSIQPDDALISAEELFSYFDRRLGAPSVEGETNG